MAGVEIQYITEKHPLERQFSLNLPRLTVDPTITTRPTSSLSPAFSSYETQKEKNPYVAGLLASVFPGAGYLYLEDYTKASVAGSLVFPIAYRYYLSDEDSPSEATTYEVSQHLLGFTIYDSFRDALEENSIAYSNMILPTKRDSFTDLYFAPFLPETYNLEWNQNFLDTSFKNKENREILHVMAIGVPLMDIGINTMYLIDAAKNPYGSINTSEAAVMIPLAVLFAFSVGASEEAHWRGFQLPAFAQLTRSPFYGNLLQATSFGLAHVDGGIMGGTPYFTKNFFAATNVTERNRFLDYDPPDAGAFVSEFSLQLIFGLSQGFLVSVHRDGLQQAAALHSIIDALAFANDYLRTGKFEVAYKASFEF